MSTTRTALHTISEPPPGVPSDGPKLAIKDNNATYSEPCAMCGEVVRARVPYWIFLQDGYESVCMACAEVTDPPLAWMLWAYYSAGGGI